MSQRISYSVHQDNVKHPLFPYRGLMGALGRLSLGYIDLAATKGILKHYYLLAVF